MRLKDDEREFITVAGRSKTISADDCYVLGITPNRCQLLARRHGIKVIDSVPLATPEPNFTLSAPADAVVDTDDDSQSTEREAQLEVQVDDVSGQEESDVEG